MGLWVSIYHSRVPAKLCLHRRDAAVSYRTVCLLLDPFHGGVALVDVDGVVPKVAKKYNATVTFTATL